MLTTEVVKSSQGVTGEVSQMKFLMIWEVISGVECSRLIKVSALRKYGGGLGVGYGDY